MKKLIYLFAIVLFVSCSKDEQPVIASKIPSTIYGTYAVDKSMIGLNHHSDPDWEIIHYTNTEVKIIEKTLNFDTLVMKVNGSKLSFEKQTFHHGKSWTVTGNGTYTEPIMNLVMSYDYGSDVYNYTVVATKK